MYKERCVIKIEFTPVFYQNLRKRTKRSLKFSRFLSFSFQNGVRIYLNFFKINKNNKKKIQHAILNDFVSVFIYLTRNIFTDVWYLKWFLMNVSFTDWIFLHFRTIGESSEKILQHFLCNSKKVMKKRRISFLRGSLNQWFWSSENSKVFKSSNLLFFRDIFRSKNNKLQKIFKKI